jgi:hypothetical protein
MPEPTSDEVPDGKARSMRPIVTLVAIGVIVLLGGLYFLLRVPGSSTSEPVQPRTFEVEITAVLPPEGLPALQARQGDPVTMVIGSEVPGTFHLHGYDRLVEVAPGTKQTLEFVAARAGWFPIGLHDQAGNEIDVTALQVDPR